MGQNKIGFLNSINKTLVFFAVLASCGFAQAQICFNDLNSYNAVKSKLPKALQSEPLYAIHESWDLTGAFRIVPVGNNIEIDAHIHSTFAGLINETAIVTKACLTDDQLEVDLNDGKSKTITVNATSLTIQGYDFDITTAAEYQKVASKVPASLEEIQ